MTSPHPAPAAHPVRRVWRVRGQVQGVGFRPFVYRLARAHGLTGTVRNDPAGVTIEAQGWPDRLAKFATQVVDEAPALASVDGMTLLAEEDVRGGETTFSIRASDHAPAERGRVTVDAAMCDDCLREALDPADRRFGHALVNCTNCGPRYTIVRDLPYDRPLTTMSPFPMCPACEAEYSDPGDRRFHAQPNCCPACGPRVQLVDAAGVPLAGDDPIRNGARLLAQGGILAVKGLGGYHLVVDACNEEAVAALRRGKRRDHKPFAVMVADLETARRLVELSGAAEAALDSPARPIVLAERRPDDGLAGEVAPANHRLGIMLAYTPIQHLLFAAGLGPLVMTSANHSDDPLLKDDDAARAALASFCDAYLVHDREIERAVDDSIGLDTPHGIVPIRRARGYVPAPLQLPVEAPAPGLCLGGELKSVVAVVRGGDVFLSQHLGDLTYTLALERFRQTIDDLRRLFDVRPAWIACDAHPGYLSRRHALVLGAALDVPVHQVQHHHAHLASLLAEHGLSEPAVGLVCDGVGYGTDGEAWGGEVLLGDLVGFERLGRLRRLRLPGGDVAARETGRCAFSWLWDRFGEQAVDHPLARVALPDEAKRRGIAEMLRTDVNCPPSSGLGRLFDAAASLLGLCDRNHHEAMSGMRMESAATRSALRPDGTGVLTVGAVDGGLFELDTRPLLDALSARIAHAESVADVAWFVHDALADGLYRAAALAGQQTGVRTVGLSGGVFCNALLAGGVAERLEHDGFEVLQHRQVPPNDGGIALGQAAVAAALMCGDSPAYSPL